MRPALLLLALPLLFSACSAGATSPTPGAQPLPAEAPTAAPTQTTLPPTSQPTSAAQDGETLPRFSTVDGMPQVYVPPGQVRMGGLDVHAEDNELPDHIVHLHGFWIDQLEVTNAMYLLCVQASGCSSPASWTSEKRLSYFNDESFKDYPVIQVTWEQANVYCAWAGRRLPTEAEWERAARGDDYRTFPWGDEPASEIYANYNRLVGDTSRVGSYAAGAGPFGALDMAGNVWEWVADYFNPLYYASAPADDPPGPGTSATRRRVIRGGSFQDEWINLRVSKRGSALGPDPLAPYDDPERGGEHSSKIGFRCASTE